MNLFSVTNRRLPGIGSFIKRSPMFHEKPNASAPTTCELIQLTTEALRAGDYKPGSDFPIPGEIAELTGASLFDSLEAVTVLLKSGSIRQDPSGRLFVPAVNNSGMSGSFGV